MVSQLSSRAGSAFQLAVTWRPTTGSEVLRGRMVCRAPSHVRRHAFLDVADRQHQQPHDGAAQCFYSTWAGVASVCLAERVKVGLISVERVMVGEIPLLGVDPEQGNGHDRGRRPRARP